MKVIRYSFIFIVTAVLILPAVLMFAGKRGASAENRALSKLPRLFAGQSVNKDFFKELDGFTEDHMGLKDRLVTLFNTADAAVLSDCAGTDAVVGKNGMLFYGATIDDHLGIGLLTDGEIASAADYISALSEELEVKGIRFAFMIAPNKASVYPENMPGCVKPTSEPRNMERLLTALEERGVELIDAKAVLIDAKEEREVYYLRDSHWNEYGAALVYNAAARAFGLDTVDEDTYTVEYDKIGDLNGFVFPSAPLNEARFVYPAAGGWTSERPIDFERDTRPIRTFSDANGLRMTFFHDSFGRSLQPFFSSAVGELVMISYFPYDTRYVYENDPDIVLIELVERNIPLLAEQAAKLGY